MTIEEIKKFLKENKETQEVKDFLAEFKVDPKEVLAELDTEKIFELSKDNKAIQSYRDKIVTKALETWKEKSLPTVLEEEITKRYPAETEDQKEMKRLRALVEDEQKQRKRDNLKIEAMKSAREKKIPDDLIDLLVSDDKESTQKNIDLVAQAFQTAVSGEVKKTFEQNGYRPGTGDSSGGDNFFTREEVKAMSPAEIEKNLDKVNESVATWT